MSTASGGPSMARWILAAVCGLAAYLLAHFAMPAQFWTNVLIGLVVAVIVLLLWSLFGGAQTEVAPPAKAWTPDPAPRAEAPVPVVAPIAAPAPVVAPVPLAEAAAAAAGADPVVAAAPQVDEAAAPAAAPVMAEPPAAEPKAVEPAVAEPKLAEPAPVPEPAVVVKAAMVPAKPKAKAAPATSKVAKSKGAPLKAARGKKADDLKQIEGIGPVLETMLNGLGYWHFDQIAAWTEAEVDEIDQKMERFKGRIRREKWVAQAQIIVTEGLDVFRERAKTNDY